VSDLRWNQRSIWSAQSTPRTHAPNTAKKIASFFIGSISSLRSLPLSCSRRGPLDHNRTMVSVEWKGSMVFEATPPSGIRFSMDAYQEVGGSGLGPTPVETLLGAIAGCSGMDVISILRKKQQVVTGYRIEVEGARTPEGEWPRPFETIVIRHVVSGENLDPAAVARAVQLSDEKYCTVVATLRSSPEIRSEWLIE